ncbi:cleavage polyadenylation factor subunit fip1, partial [Dimargaris verticillata]
MASQPRDRAANTVEDAASEAPKKSFVDQQSLPQGELSSDSEDDIVLDLAKDTGTKSAPVAAPAPASETKVASADTAATATKKPGLDINTAGQYKGQDIYHYDVANADEKPWEKPGADITDYFNYGFNEKTWQEYSAKQIKLREEQQQRRQINVFDSSNQDASESGLPIPNLNQPGGMGSRMTMGPMPGMMPQFMPNVPMGMGEHDDGSDEDGPNQQFGMRPNNAMGPMFNMNMGPMNFG